MENFNKSDTPTKIGCLLIDDFALMSYFAVVEPSRAAKLLAGRAIFEVVHFAVFGQHAESLGELAVEGASTAVGDCKIDYLFVLAGGDPARFDDEAVFEWLWVLAERGLILVGVSGGPVILAASA